MWLRLVYPVHLRSQFFLIAMIVWLPFITKHHAASKACGITGQYAATAASFPSPRLEAKNISPQRGLVEPKSDNGCCCRS